MYLCLCHGLNEAAVQRAQAAGATTAVRVYRHYGVKPQCGKCVRAVHGAVTRCDVPGGDGPEGRLCHIAFETAGCEAAEEGRDVAA